MSWLFDERIVTTVFRALIVLTPIAAAIGWFAHSRLAGGCGRNGRAGWIIVALAGPLNFGLWTLYNAIENHWGLDQVKPLLINAAIFVTVGIVAGVALRLLLRPPAP